MQKNLKNHSQRVTECRRKLYDQIQINLPKGTREKYKQFADSQKMSLNTFVVTAMDEYIARHEITFITMLEVPQQRDEKVIVEKNTNE